MIPDSTQDYMKYFRLFRSDRYKGTSILKMLLTDPVTANALVTTFPACHSIFVDNTRSSADGACLNTLVSYPDYYEKALFLYLNRMGITNKVSFEEVINDLEEAKKLRNDSATWTLLKKTNYLPTNLFRLRQNFNTVFADPTKTQLAVAADTEFRNMYNDYVVNPPASRKTWTTPCDAVLAAAGYNLNSYCGMHFIDKWEQLLISAYVYTQSGGSYFPIFLRYDCKTNTAKIELEDKTYANTSPANDGLQCPYPAYDETNDVAYMFYNSPTDAAKIHCSAIQLTETSSTLLFKGITASTQKQGTTNYYKILNVSAANGKASCAWHNWAHVNTSSNAPICYCTVNQSGAVVSERVDLMTPISISTASYYSLNVFPISSYGCGCLQTKYYLSNVNYVTFVFPTEDGNGTFVKTDFTVQYSNTDGTVTPNNHNLSSANYPIGFCKEGRLVYGQAMGTSGGTGRYKVSVMLGTQKWDLDYQPMVNQGTASVSSPQYDPFTGILSFTFYNKYYMWTKELGFFETSNTINNAQTAIKTGTAYTITKPMPSGKYATSSYYYNINNVLVDTI